MVITGIGLGLMMQVFVLSVQNSVPSRHIGSATALAQFARSIGSTLGVTIMGVIVNQGLPVSVRSNQESIHRLPPQGRVALADALHPAFLAAASVCAIVFALVVFGIREVPLRRGLEETTVGSELDAGGGAEPAAATRPLR
jgi:MFS family permease